MTDEHGTALGSAHARFLDSLGERGRELRELADALEPAPSDDRLAERLRRRVHALYASAQLFQESSLLDRLGPLVARLDAARDGYRGISDDELRLVRGLCDLLGVEAEQIVPAPRSRSLRSGERWSVPALERDARTSPSDPALLLTQTIAGGVIAPEVIAALLVASPEVESEVRAALPAEYCEITSTGEPETALLVIDHVAPDLVMIEAGSLREGAESLVQGLRGERRAIVALLPELASETDAQLGLAWADAVLRLPLPRAGLLERLQRLAGRGARPQSALERLQAGTIDEIARSIGDEVRRGITGALRTGRGERIELGDKTELLAATWSAVARIRAHLADRGEGRVRFDGSAFAGEPFALALTDDEPAAPYVGLSESLAGRRIVIVDDDPSVVWFFAGLVREAGAIAIEARDGREALALMRKHPPDLLVSDIVMPEIDGFGLCRELKRDVALCHVPVVLLSWKEDFLQRMRELDAGASAYLRKEAGTHQILSTLAEALRPRAALASLLTGGGEVHGRVDALGVAALLQTVAQCRPNARVSVRDAWNLFEIDLRDGTRVGITRTAADGSFARGRPALLQLLGVDVGRFGVDDADGPLRGELGESLDRALHEGLAELGGLFDALSDTSLMQVARVDLDDEVLRPLLAATPTALADLVNRLRAGASPHDLLVAGIVGGRELEQQLRELARRGAILRASASDGSDLALAAWRAREERPGQLMHGGEHAARSSLPPPLAETDVEWLEPRNGERPARGRSSRPPPMPRRVTRSTPPPPLRRALRARVASGPVPPLPGARAAAAAAAAADAAASDASADAASSGAPSSAPTATSTTPSTDSSASHAPPLPARSTSSASLPAVTPAGSANPASSAPARSSGSPAENASRAASAASTGVAATAVRAAAASAPKAPRRSWPLTALTLCALAAIGFFGDRWLAARIEPSVQRSVPAHPAAIKPAAPLAAPAPRAQPEPTPAEQPSAGLPSAEAPSAEAQAEPVAEDEAAAQVAHDTRPVTTRLDAVEVTPGYGRVLPFIDRSRGVEVGADEGLLVVESDSGENAPSVRIAGRDIGRAPTAAALPPGRHELVLRRGTQTSFRYVVIRAGETRVVDGH